MKWMGIGNDGINTIPKQIFLLLLYQRCEVIKHLLNLTTTNDWYKQGFITVNSDCNE